MWRMTFEALLTAAVLIILTWLLKLWRVMENFIGINTKEIRSFVKKRKERLGSICEAIYFLIFGLNRLNFRLRELLMCTKMCTKASSLMLVLCKNSSSHISRLFFKLCKGRLLIQKCALADLQKIFLAEIGFLANFYRQDRHSSCCLAIRA